MLLRLDRLSGLGPTYFEACRSRCANISGEQMENEVATGVYVWGLNDCNTAMGRVQLQLRKDFREGFWKLCPKP